MTQAYKITYFLLCISFVQAYSQSFEHRNFRYDWKDEIRVTLQQDEKYKDYDAVILHEETTLDIELKNIKRYQVFQFNSQAAIDKYNWFRVPINMEPPLSAIQNIYRNDSVGFPNLLYEKINFFDARIIRNGSFVKAVLDEIPYRREERNGEVMIPYYVHCFYVRNLQPGDQLEVIMSHQWPGFTYKYFLNERLPKQEVYIKLNNSPLGEVHLYLNSALASFISSDKSANGNAFQIVMEDLKPMDPNIPTNFNELPRVEFWENKKYVTSNQFFGQSTVDTISWRDYLFPFVNSVSPSETRTWEYYDIQSYKVSQFFSKMKQLHHDSLQGADLMNVIHRYAVEKLNYKNDFNYFIHLLHGFNDLGSHLENDTLREASRDEFYYHMLDRINIPYYKVYLQDQRYKTIDTNVVSPIFDDYLSYLVFDKDSVSYLYCPKRGRFGYYANELPFYLLNQYAFLIPQLVPRKIYNFDPGSIQFPLVYYPPSTYVHNYKKTKSAITISLANQTTSIESNLILSGQFSTMTRGYYQYGWIDTTVSPTYYHDIYRNITGTTIELKTGLKTFPYEHQFHLVSPEHKNIFSTLDGSYSIELSDLINIHYTDFERKYFSGRFKHDFPGKEEYAIELDFDQLVTIENMDSYNREVKGNGFHFISSLVKIADNQFGLKIVWDVRTDYTEAVDLAKLVEAFQQIKKFTQLKLRVKVQ